MSAVRPLWSRLKHLISYWIDFHKIVWHLWSRGWILVILWLLLLRHQKVDVCGLGRNVSTAVGCIVMQTFIVFADLSDPLAFHLAPSSRPRVLSAPSLVLSAMCHQQMFSHNLNDFNGKHMESPPHVDNSSLKVPLHSQLRCMMFHSAPPCWRDPQLGSFMLHRQSCFVWLDDGLM